MVTGPLTASAAALAHAAASLRADLSKAVHSNAAAIGRTILRAHGLLPSSSAEDDRRGRERVAALGRQFAAEQSRTRSR